MKTFTEESTGKAYNAPGWPYETGWLHQVRLHNESLANKYINTFRNNPMRPLNNRNKEALRYSKVLKFILKQRRFSRNVRKQNELNTNEGHAREINFLKRVINRITPPKPNKIRLRYTLEELSKKTIPELKVICEKLGLRKTGKKSILIQSIIQKGK